MTGNAILGDWGTSNAQPGGHIIYRIDGLGIGMVDRPAREVLMELTAGWRLS
ncbi:hypothetical protein GCM10011494_02150 [Novosphingobium endophyticum]|uniref:Uncharacterized protein n=1 Tax=Novosphingobium endophyticum TaxID=1955250 RepID=A0A916TP44_9SPHN|nr:hypothetical protein [Novosphingobium endophyticum]GGB87368.1 hypothetical protein GCM10011494_02150 [Novosphingobium endophyticum]